MRANRWLLILIVTLTWQVATRAKANAGTTASDASERHFEMLKVGELAFTNVWVHRQTNFNVLIRHSGGIHTIKLTDLPADQLAELKSQVGDLAAIDQQTAGEKPVKGLIETLKAALKNANPQTLAVAAAAAVLLVSLVIVVRRRGGAAPPA